MKRVISILLAITMVLGLSSTASALSPPEYPTKMFDNVNALVAWIQSEKLDSFQEGRYKNGISSLRNLGKVLSLSYASPDITMRFIEALYDDFDSNNRTVMAYYFYTETQRVVIFVKQMNASYAAQAKEGPNSYFAAQYGSQFKNLPVLEAGSVKYIKTVVATEDWSSGEAKPSEEKLSSSYFISNGFEIEVTQDQAVEDDRFIRELQIKPVAFSSTSSSSSKSSGGGGGGGGDRATAATPAQTTSPLSAAAGKTAVQNAVKAAAPGSKKAFVSLKNVASVSLPILKEMAAEAQKAGTELTVNFDQIVGKKVTLRLGINPALAKNDIDVTMSTDSAQAKKVQGITAKWFANSTFVISCGQKESFGQSVAIAAALPEKFSTANLKFYRYDSAQNKYTEITGIKYWTDSTGYLHFTTETAGDIVVSDGPLKKK